MTFDSLYQTFLFYFIGTGSLCFVIDMKFPELRFNHFKLTKSKILADYKHMLPRVATNALVSYPYFAYTESNLLPMDNATNKYPFLFNLILWVLVTDFMFYFFHYALHMRPLYKYIHAIHHEYKIPYGIGAIYAHPLEFIVGNVVPISAPMILFQMSRLHCHLLVAMATIGTTLFSHGGFFISKSHLIHHNQSRCNYGIVYTDWLFGTKEKVLKLVG